MSGEGVLLALLVSVSLHELYLVVEPVERQVCSENGYRAVLFVVDGHLVGNQGYLLFGSVDKALAPIALIPAERLLEPGFVQVVMLRVAQDIM